jgi:multicomponent Na+:H+ antiporter subunit F
VNTVWTISAVMLTAAVGITMYRLLAGPGTLDRLVALDTFVAVTMCAIGTWAAYSLDTTVTYSLTALALISFVGSVSVARFRVRDKDLSRVRDKDLGRGRDTAHTDGRPR